MNCHKARVPASALEKLFSVFLPSLTSAPVTEWVEEKKREGGSGISDTTGPLLALSNKCALFPVLIFAQEGAEPLHHPSDLSMLLLSPSAPTKTWQWQCLQCPAIAAQHAEWSQLISSLGSLPSSAAPPAAPHCPAACVARHTMGAWALVSSPTGTELSGQSG